MAIFFISVAALIRASLVMSFFHNHEELNDMLSRSGPATVVVRISTTLLNTGGSILAVKMEIINF